MLYRKVGQNGPMVSSFGLGCMGMSGTYGGADRHESIATIQAALEAGFNLFDTGDFYGCGHNEILLNEALRNNQREKVFIAVKFGAMRTRDGGWNGYDCR